jgi:hypothetical protein
MGATTPHPRDHRPCLPQPLRHRIPLPILTALQVPRLLEWQLSRITIQPIDTHPISPQFQMPNTPTMYPRHLCHIHPRMGCRHRIRGLVIPTTDHCLFHNKVILRPRCHQIMHMEGTTRRIHHSWWCRVSTRCNILPLLNAHLHVTCARSRSIVNMTSSGIGRRILVKSRSYVMADAARRLRERMH